MPHIPGHIQPLDDFGSTPTIPGAEIETVAPPIEDIGATDPGKFTFDPGATRDSAGGIKRLTDALDFRVDSAETKVEGLDPDAVTTTSEISPIVEPTALDLDPSKTIVESKIFEPEVVKPIEETPPKEEPKKEKPGEEAPTKVATDLDKTIDSLVDDIDLSGLEFIKSFMEGDDPLAEAAWNFEVGKLGPIWEAQNASLILKLKQMGISGQNAGTAWLQNMAQRQGVQLSDITSRLNFESVQRIQDWNRYGPERANQIISNRLNRQINKYDFGFKQITDQGTLGNTDPQSYINIAAANGVTMSKTTADFVAENVGSENELDKIAALREINTNYAEIENDLQVQVPGLSIDGSAYGSLTSEQQNDLRQRIKGINKAIKTNDVATAQQLMKELKELYPNAVAGNYDAWNPADFRTMADQNAKNSWSAKAKTQFDNGNTSEAIDILIDKVIDPTTVDEVFQNLWDTSSPERREKIMEGASLDGQPISGDDKAQYIAYDKLDGMQKTTTEEMFKSYYNNAPANIKEWLNDPENAELTKAWIFDVVSGPYEVDDNGLIVPVAGQQLPPWNEDSNNSHFFMDWAMADSYNEEDGTLNITYAGSNVYEDDNEFQTSEGYAAYRAQMDDAWESYKKGGGELDRQRWFQDVNPVWDGTTLVFNGEARESFDDDESLETTESGIVLNPNPQQATENFDNFVNLTKDKDSIITDEDVVFSLPQATGVQSIPSSQDATNEFLRENASGLGSNPDGWINFEGTALQIQSGGTTSSKRIDISTYKVTDENGGGTFSLGENGKWYAGDMSLANDTDLDDYALADQDVFPKVELPKPPNEMTQEELQKWSEYSEYITGIFALSPKAASVPVIGFEGLKLSSFGQIIAAHSFDDWFAAGKPEFNISKDTATKIRQDL